MATKSKSSIWICQHCTTRNNIKLQRCSVCYQPRAKIQQSAPKNNGIYPALMGKKNGLNQNDILKRGPLQKKGSGVFDGWKTRLSNYQLSFFIYI